MVERDSVLTCVKMERGEAAKMISDITKGGASTVMIDVEVELYGKGRLEGGTLEAVADDGRSDAAGRRDGGCLDWEAGPRPLRRGILVT